MIKLKTEVNKTKLMSDVKTADKKMYEHTYGSDAIIDGFVNGAAYVLSKLSLSDVSN